jgi:hypothetical protein
MDQEALVEGGADGLIRIERAFQASGLAISGIYLIRLTSHDGFEEHVIRLVSDQKTPDLTRKMIVELIKLRRNKDFPKVDPGVRFDMVSAGDLEASRIIDYARRLGGHPVVIRDAMWKGLFIEYALVAGLPQADFAAV